MNIYSQDLRLDFYVCADSTKVSLSSRLICWHEPLLFTYSVCRMTDVEGTHRALTAIRLKMEVDKFLPFQHMIKKFAGFPFLYMIYNSFTRVVSNINCLLFL